MMRPDRSRCHFSCRGGCERKHGRGCCELERGCCLRRMLTVAALLQPLPPVYRHGRRPHPRWRAHLAPLPALRQRRRDGREFGARKHREPLVLAAGWRGQGGTAGACGCGQRTLPRAAGRRRRRRPQGSCGRAKHVLLAAAGAHRRLQWLTRSVGRKWPAGSRGEHGVVESEERVPAYCSLPPQSLPPQSPGCPHPQPPGRSAPGQVWPHPRNGCRQSGEVPAGRWRSGTARGASPHMHVSGPPPDDRTAPRPPTHPPAGAGFQTPPQSQPPETAQAPGARAWQA